MSLSKRASSSIRERLMYNLPFFCDVITVWSSQFFVVLNHLNILFVVNHDHLYAEKMSIFITNFRNIQVFHSQLGKGLTSFFFLFLLMRNDEVRANEDNW